MNTNIIRKGAICSAHHPRGGTVTGPVSAIYKGLYGKERKINGMSFPASQVRRTETIEKSKWFFSLSSFLFLRFIEIKRWLLVVLGVCFAHEIHRFTLHQWPPSYRAGFNAGSGAGARGKYGRAIRGSSNFGRNRTNTLDYSSRIAYFLRMNKTTTTNSIRKGNICAAHHPRGGIVSGPVSSVYKGLYGKERKINGMGFPVEQIWIVPTEPKSVVE